MVQFFESISKIKDSNFLILLEKSASEIPLQLDENILRKVKNSLEENKSFFHTFFVGTPQFEYIYIGFYKPDPKKDIYEFLAETITRLPRKLTLFSPSKGLLKSLLDTTLLARYKFQHYKSEKSPDVIKIYTSKINKAFLIERLETLKNILFARDLWETPTHDLTPEKFANIIKQTKFKNTKVKIFGPKEIDKLWMGLLKWVGWGSPDKPYFVVLERIVNKTYPTIGFVGKWVVFDTGGLNIKLSSPIGWMELMKFDMCGAATVLAVMKELDEKKLKVNIIAAMPIAENSIGSAAMRPSDILTSYSGKTVQILNTDAEWRLILADAVSYLSKNYEIDHFITIATLTWLCVMTFGYRYAAIMGDDTMMMDKLKKYSANNFEKYWELPFDDFYIEKTKSQIADYDNHSPHVLAWTIMGGAFIYNFRLKDEKFTHIDIASVASIKGQPYGLYPKGVTGFWVDSLSYIFQNM